MAKIKKHSRVAEAILKTANDMRRVGIVDKATPQKITVRHLDPKAIHTAAPISAAEIRKLRERAHLSQAAFARYLNLTVGYVSQLERGIKEPKGAALALLNVVRRKGVEVVL